MNKYKIKKKIKMLKIIKSLAIWLALLCLVLGLAKAADDGPSSKQAKDFRRASRGAGFALSDFNKQFFW